MGIPMAPFVFLAAMLAVVATVATAMRGLQAGVWRFPLGVLLSVGLFGLMVWASTGLDGQLRYWGDETLADEWQAEVKSHMSDMTGAVFPGSDLRLLPDLGTEWCGFAVSENFIRTVRWEVGNGVPTSAKVDEARTWLLDNHPSYSGPWTASDGRSFSVDTPRGGHLTLSARRGAPTIWWDSPCIGTKRAWWLPTSQFALVVLAVATGVFTAMWWRHRNKPPDAASTSGA